MDSFASNGTRHQPTRRAIAGWVTYDLANQMFTMGVVSMFFAVWVREMIGADRADTAWGLITSVSYFMIFVLSPLLGAMTDRAPRRMPFLVVSTLVCVGLTALLGRTGFAVSVGLFIMANVAYQAGVLFYDSLLPAVSTPQNRGRIGGLGIAFGYIGSFVPVTLGLVLGTEDKPLLFLLLAGIFLVLALPCFLLVREPVNPNPRPIFQWAAIRTSAAETVRTLRAGSEYPGVLRFLIGRVFYTDAINTVIIIMMLFTVNVAMAGGLSDAEGERVGLLVMAFALFFAVAGGLFWGRVVDRVGPRRSLMAVLWAWMAVFLLGALVGIFALPLVMMYLLGASAGFSLGGVWASDRVFMLRLAPPNRVGEFYGLYAMVGRFSAITGPASWALILYITGQVFGLAPHVGQGVGVSILLLQIVISYFILRPVSDQPRPALPSD